MKICCGMAALMAVGLAAGSIALAQPEKKPATQPEKKTAGQPDKVPAAKPGSDAAAQPQLPPGWTEADMKACMEAGTPGPMHAYLAKGTGVWTGKCTMWMAPNTEPMKNDCTSTVTTMMDGKYIKCEMAGEMPGMGPFSGFGISGFDNVSQKFQSTWIDNMGTGIMFGTGELSPDQKTLTWKFNYFCPIAKKQVTMRQVEKRTGDNSLTMEMYGPEPKTGVEYKMMEIALTRKGGEAAKTKGADASKN